MAEPQSQFDARSNRWPAERGQGLAWDSFILSRDDKAKPWNLEGNGMEILPSIHASAGATSDASSQHGFGIA